MKAFVVILAAWVLTACVRLNPGDTIRTLGFEHPGERLALQEAVDGWNEAVPRLQLRLVHVGRGRWTIERYAHSEPKFGHTPRWRPRITIDAAKLARSYPHAPLEHLKSTAMHEIGHALGMRGHLPAPALLQAPHGGFTCVDYHTLAWLLRERPELREGAKVTCEPPEAVE